MQRMTDVPYSVVDVIQGLIIIFVIAKYTALDKITRLFQPLRAKGGKRHAE